MVATPHELVSCRIGSVERALQAIEPRVQKLFGKPAVQGDGIGGKPDLGHSDLFGIAAKVDHFSVKQRFAQKMEPHPRTVGRTLAGNALEQHPRHKAERAREPLPGAIATALIAVVRQLHLNAPRERRQEHVTQSIPQCIAVLQSLSGHVPREPRLVLAFLPQSRPQ
ncbi:hypothetical protein HRbin30_02539 [bacterium HR30]|nr:hypothetical protein HRbin30_02539 [bacterium HR30]